MNPSKTRAEVQLFVALFSSNVEGKKLEPGQSSKALADATLDPAWKASAKNLIAKAQQNHGRRGQEGLPITSCLAVQSDQQAHGFQKSGASKGLKTPQF